VDEDRRREAEARVNDLRIRLDAAPAQVKQGTAWHEATQWVQTTLEHLTGGGPPKETDPDTWWEDFDRFLDLHTGALEVALEDHRRKLEQDRRKRERQWAGEKGRLKDAEASFLMLKILMILAWTAALGAGLSTRTLGILAVAPAALGGLEIRRQLRALPPGEFVVERQAMFDLREKFNYWFYGFAAAAVVGALFTLVKTFLLD